MIFPTLNLRSSPDDPLGRIDRAINDRNHRLSAGISISNRFDNVRGALVVAQGNGKYLRVRHVVEASTAISRSIREGCLEVFHGRLHDVGQISQLISDLAEPQATVVEQLKCQAGKYVDRVLAVAVRDPGVWNHDFDGRISYASLCDATRLAELSGVTVIDAFPARDLAVGGNGDLLESLPYWIMFADRDPRVASQSRLVVSIDDRCLSYLLPASDGLDSDVPQVTTFGSLGIGFLNEFVGRHIPDAQGSPELDRHYANGQQVPALRKQWELVADSYFQSAKSSDHGFRNLNDSWSDQNNLQLSILLADAAESYLKANANAFSNVIRTGIRWIVDQCLDPLPVGEQLSVCGETKIGSDFAGSTLLVSCPTQYEAALINQFTQLSKDRTVTTTRQAGIDRIELAPVVAALLGLFHIDQMPANIPWLTGANCQRILGRLTPGRPSNWRQLVRVMADFKPAPMKLKDAI